MDKDNSRGYTKARRVARRILALESVFGIVRGSNQSWSAGGGYAVRKQCLELSGDLQLSVVKHSVYQAQGLATYRGFRPVQAVGSSRSCCTAFCRTYCHRAVLRLLRPEDAQAEARHSLAATDQAGRGVLEIDHDGIRQRIEFQERKRQANIASVVREAAAGLGDKEVPAHEPDPDWTARFFDGVQDVSSEDMRKIWAKILSGEVEEPGRTSLRTLSILRDMSQRDAEAFSALMEYRISEFIFEGWIEPPIAKKLSSSFKLLLHTGLVYPIHPTVFSMSDLVLGDNGEYVEEYCGHVLRVEGPPGTSIDPMNLSLNALTPSGEELARYCGNEPNFDYLSRFSHFLEARGCKLQLAPIVLRDSNGTLHFRPEALRTIEPIPDGRR